MRGVDEIKIDGYEPIYEFYSDYMGERIRVSVTPFQNLFKTGMRDTRGEDITLTEEQSEFACNANIPKRWRVKVSEGVKDEWGGKLAKNGFSLVKE